MNEEQAFASVVAVSKSVGDVLRRMRRAKVGTNYEWARRKIAELSLDVSHFRAVKNRRRELKDVLVECSSFSTGNVKRRLVREGLIKEVCAECGLGTSWRGKPLVLRLDHVNGKRDDNRRENLRLLCPNCDSQTDTFCGRNKASREPNRCECGMVISNKSKRCRVCSEHARHRGTKIEWPEMQFLLGRLEVESCMAVARGLGVSDNAVRKHCRRYGYVVTNNGIKPL